MRIALESFKATLCLAFIAIGSGSLAAFFLKSLDAVTATRLQNSWLIWLLPVAGWLSGILYQKWGQALTKGNTLIVESIRSPRAPLPLRMIPMVLGGTLLTHLVGGSAGREGTAVQMGGALADQLTTFQKLRLNISRKTLLRAGIAGGFAGVFGTPLAAFAFAFEIVRSEKITLAKMLGVLFTAWLAHQTCLAWQVHHTVYPKPVFIAQEGVDAALELFVSLAALAVIFGTLARIFVWLHRQFGDLAQKIRPLHWRGFAGGTLVLGLTLTLGSHQFLGLGIAQIQAAFVETTAWSTPLWKTLFTVITTSTGFAGGEVTPLFFVGATAGSAIAPWFEMSVSLAAALGFVAVFGAAAQTPLAAMLMGCEIFGWQFAPYAMVVCYASAFLAFSGRRLYH